MDLRPANIMWREVSGSDTVELTIIDFEYAVRYGHTIPAQFIKEIVDSSDFRFPFTSSDKLTRQRASAIHNRFFLIAVSEFLLSDMGTFTEFMTCRGQEILRQIRESNKSNAIPVDDSMSTVESLPVAFTRLDI